VDRSGKDPADVGRRLAAGRLSCPGMFGAAGRVFPVIHDEDVGVIAGENGRACDGPAGLVPAVVCVVAAWWSVPASAATAARQDATWRGHYRLIWLRTSDRSGTASLTKTWPDLRRDIGGMSFPLQILRSDAAHERHEFPFGRFEVFKVAGQTLGRAIYKPGWRWSQHIGPSAGTPLCEVAHIGVVLAGRAAVKMRDGAEIEMGPNDWFSIPAGHDSWVIGDDDYVSFHLMGAQDYVAPSAGVNDEPSAQRSTVSAELLQHSVWGDGCRGWTLLTRPALHVTEEEMTAHTQERRHVHSAVTQLYYVLDGEAVVDVAGTDLGAKAGRP
jgi:mannose-6-phosphate isomerase-like protein (cupin superfamily)